MDKRLEKIKQIFEKEYEKPDIFVWDDEDSQALEVINLVHFCIDNNKLLISFYSDVNPSVSAGVVNMLFHNKVKDFYLSGTIYPDIKNGEYVDMLFDEEADERYLQTIYEERKSAIDFAINAITYGPKQ